MSALRLGFACLVLLSLLLGWPPRATLVVDLETQGQPPDQVQAFFTLEGYSEGVVGPVTEPVRPGRSTYSYSITSLAERIRFDPAERSCHFIIHSMKLKYLGITLADFGAQRYFGWLANPGIANVKVEGTRLEGDSTGKDPYLTGPPVSALTWLRRIYAGLGLLLLILTVRWAATVPTGSRRSRALELRWDLLISGALCVAGMGLAYWLFPKVNPDPHRSLVFSNPKYAPDLRDREGRKIFPGNHPIRYELSPFVWYRLAANQNHPWLRTDARGFRVTTGVGEGRPVAVLLGGSTAFGYGSASDDETPSSQLQKVRSGEAWVNAAVIGYRSGNELGQMVHYADDLHPSLYVLLDGWNDFGTEPKSARLSLLGYNDDWMSAIETQLWEHYLETRPPGDPDPELHFTRGRSLGVTALRKKALETYGANLLRMKAFAQGRGARFFVVLQPQPAPGSTWNAEYLAFCREVMSFCRASGLQCLDLNASPEIKAAGLALYSEGVHLTVTGSATVARVISDWIGK